MKPPQNWQSWSSALRHLRLACLLTRGALLPDKLLKLCSMPRVSWMRGGHQGNSFFFKTFSDFQRRWNCATSFWHMCWYVLYVCLGVWPRAPLRVCSQRHEHFTCVLSVSWALILIIPSNYGQHFAWDTSFNIWEIQKINPYCDDCCPNPQLENLLLSLWHVIRRWLSPLSQSSVDVINATAATVNTPGILSMLSIISPVHNRLFLGEVQPREAASTFTSLLKCPPRDSAWDAA